MTCTETTTHFRSDAATSAIEEAVSYNPAAPHLVLYRIAVIIAAAALAVTAAQADTAPADFFPVGVYWQPTQSFAKWKSRGINTVIGTYTNASDLAQFDQAAAANNLWMIRNPQTNVAADATTPHLLAFTQPDEPDINRIPVATLAANYARWKAADAGIPVISNFSGQNAMYQYDGLTDALYQQYMQSSDWTSSDIYPITAWNKPQWIDKKAKLNLADPANNGGVPFNAGNSVDKLRSLSGGKKQFAYIETSYQHLTSGPSKGARGATAAEVRGETWDAIIHGAKGIIYFPQSFGPDKTDATPKSVAKEITKTDAKIAEMATVLNSDSDESSNAMTLTGGLEGSWRISNGKAYYFVLNFSHSSTKRGAITLPGLPTGTVLTAVDESRTLTDKNGGIVDNFKPYQLHIYEATAPVGLTNLGSGNHVVVSAVPEPTCAMWLGLGAIGLLRRRRHS